MQPQQGQLTKFDSLLRGNYSITQVALDEEDIPDTVNTLVIAAPKQQFSDWELFLIDQFLMEGKSLAIFMESFNEIQQDPNQQMYGMNQPVYLPINTGLERLLSHYGASVKKAYVMDESCYVSQDQVSGEMPLYFAPIIRNEKINHRLGFLENIKELIMIKVSPLVIDKERIDANGLRMTELFSSSSRSWEMAGQINLMPWMISPPATEEEMGSFPLAYLIEGEFPSYFADRPIPEKPEESAAETESPDEEAQVEPSIEPEQDKPVVESKIKRDKPFLPVGRPGRIFLIGAADILQDNVLDDQGKSPNAVFLLNTLDYLNNKEDMAVMRSKNQTFNPLRDTQAVTRTFFKMVNIAGLPILFILSGFGIFVRRKAKKRAIQAIFNPQKAEKEKKP